MTDTYCIKSDDLRGMNKSGHNLVTIPYMGTQSKNVINHLAIVIPTNFV